MTSCLTMLTVICTDSLQERVHVAMMMSKRQTCPLRVKGSLTKTIWALCCCRLARSLEHLLNMFLDLFMSFLPQPLSLSGIGWLPFCGEPRGKHRVCVRQCDSVSAVQAGGADQHQCL